MFSCGGDEPPKILRFEPKLLRCCHRGAVRISPTRMLEETRGWGKSCGGNGVAGRYGGTGGGEGLGDRGEEVYSLQFTVDSLRGRGEEVEELKVES